MVRDFNTLDARAPHNAAQTPDGVFFVESPRARRQRDISRLKARVARFVRDVWHTNTNTMTPRQIGRLTSNHGIPCSCRFFCANKRAAEGPSIAERRATDSRSIHDDIITEINETIA